MGNLRELAEADLAETLEDPEDWGLPVVLIDPDGDKQEVTGKVLYNTTVQNPQTGGDVLVPKPVAVVRLSSLTRVPEANENWAMQIPRTPDADADKVTYSIEKPISKCGSIGFIRLYGTLIEQVEA